MKRGEVEEKLKELGKTLWSYRIKGEELWLESPGSGKFKEMQESFLEYLNQKGKMALTLDRGEIRPLWILKEKGKFYMKPRKGKKEEISKQEAIDLFWEAQEDIMGGHNELKIPLKSIKEVSKIEEETGKIKVKTNFGKISLFWDGSLWFKKE